MVLELMHFPEELVDLGEFKRPAPQNVDKRELDMALRLVDTLTSEWRPDEYTDEYRQKLERLIEQKVAHGTGASPHAVKSRAPSNVVDLVSVLQKSIQETENRGKRRDGSRARANKGRQGSAARVRKQAA